MNKVLEHFRIDHGMPDRVTIWIDVAGRSVNVFCESVFSELCKIVVFLEEQSKSSRTPLLFRSAKNKGFVVGADLRRIAQIRSDEQVQQFMLIGQQALDRLQRSPLMTIAVIDGPCLGGGLEFALACQHRIASDSPGTLLGMPEVKLGLMPGWGGTHRLVAKVGPFAGLKMLLSGEPIQTQHAHEIGLIDAVINPEEMEQGITNYLRDLPWTRDLSSASIPSVLTREQVAGLGPLSPAQDSILQAVQHGLHSPAAGLGAERTLFFGLLQSDCVQENLRRFRS